MEVIENHEAEPESLSCPRCGYTTTYRPTMKKHLERKRPCPAALSDISLETIMRQYPHLMHKPIDMSKHYECNWCQSRFSTRQGLSRHRSHYCQHKPPSKIEKAQEKAQAKAKEDIAKQKIRELELTIELMKENKNEKAYQHLLETHRFPGASHRKLACGITDITTDTVHAEIKHYSGWKEAIGQLMAYNAVLPRPELHVYFFGKYAPSCKKMAAQVMATTSIQPFEMRITEDAFILEHLITGEQTTYPLPPTSLAMPTQSQDQASQ